MNNFSLEPVTGGSPNYVGSSGGGSTLLDEEYADAGAEAGAGAGSSLPSFNTRFGGAFACATSRPSTVYGAPALAANAYTHQVNTMVALRYRRTPLSTSRPPARRSVIIEESDKSD